jgi:hypothetical protein
MVLIVIILLCVAGFFLYRVFFRTADAMIIKHAMHENNKAKDKIFNAIEIGNLNLASDYFQEEKGRLKHHLSIAKVSIYEIEAILESFDIWYKDVKCK